MTQQSTPPPERWHRRAVRWLGGEEQVGSAALPVEEFAHPWPLLALALLGVNDHLLKGSGWLPGWLTGKLSDFAGLFWFPLFLTAALDSLLYLVFRVSGGRTPDYSLSRGKLLGAIAFTAILFVPLKLSDAWGSLYIRAMHALDVLDLWKSFAVVRDPTDLVALVMFPLAYWHGIRFVRRIPIGRLRVLEARVARTRGATRRAVLDRGTADVRRLLGGAAEREEALDAFLAAFDRALPLRPEVRATQEAEVALLALRTTLERRS